MNGKSNRREWIRKLTASGLAAGCTGFLNRHTSAQSPGESSGFQSSILEGP